MNWFIRLLGDDKAEFWAILLAFELGLIVLGFIDRLLR